MNEKIYISETNAKYKEDLNKFNLKVVGKEKVGNKIKTKVKCLICGNEELVFLYSLGKKKNTPCKICTKGKKSWNKKSFESYVKTRGDFELVGDFVKISQNVEMKCLKCNHTWDCNLKHFLRGSGCPHCAGNQKKDLEKVKKEIESTNEYVLIGDYKSANDYITVLHKSCGKEFKTLTGRFRSGSRCPYCFGTPQKTKEEFIEDLKLLNPDFTLTGEYINNKTKTSFKHLVCGKEELYRPDLLLYKHSKCKCQKKENSGTSKVEEELFEFIMKNYDGVIIKNDREVLKPKELDIYLPELNLAFEFDGLYWHSEDKVGKHYHLNKTIECEKKGIQLVHVFEDDWSQKEKICKSRILNLLKKPNKRLYARNCKVEKISLKEKNDFLETNHLQGSNNSSIIYYALKHNKEIVSVITLGFNRYKRKKDIDGTFELLRFSNKIGYSVVGGFSKLLKNVIKMHKEIKCIKTFADRRWSKGNVYEKNGFIFSHDSKPNYFYFKQGERFSRNNFQKHKLKNKLEIFYENKTEKENMILNGYEIIFDSGNKVYYYNI